MFKYIILGLVLSFNAAAADLSLDAARESIGSSLNNVVKDIKQLFNESAEDLNNVETKDIDNKARVESLKQKSEEHESNPTVLKHAKKAIPTCDYNSKNLVWDGSTWKCVTMSVDTECQAAAPDEYMYKDADGNNVCAKSPKGSSINYYYVFRGYSSKCTGANSGYEKLYDCVYKNKLGQVIDVNASNCSGKTKPTQPNKLCAKAWTVGSWGSCSKSCGGGTKTRSVYCQAGYDCSMYTKPTSTMSCNTQKCAGKWVTGSWSSCSAKTCGTTGTQTRSVSCPSHLDCSAAPRPSSTQSCSTPACPQCTWSIGTWGSCSAKACGSTGTQTRSVTKSGPANCVGPTTPKPATSQSCSTPACQQCTWATSAWSACSTTACGSRGTQTRSVTKTGPAGCIGPSTTKPATSQYCYTPACQQCTWSTGAWSKCSATACGTTGTQTRSVTKTGPAGCIGPSTPQPARTQSCSAPACQYKGCGSYSRSITECSKNHGVVRSRNSSYTHGASESVGIISNVDRKYEVDYTIKCNNGSWQVIGSTKLFNYQTGESYKCASQPAKSYIWMQHSWGTCSKSCGGGVQYRTVNCVEISDPKRPVVSDSICHTKLGTKPATSQSCNTQSCGGTWVKDGTGSLTCLDQNRGKTPPKQEISSSNLGKKCTSVGKRAAYQIIGTNYCSYNTTNGPRNLIIYYAKCK